MKPKSIENIPLEDIEDAFKDENDEMKWYIVSKPAAQVA